MEEYERRVNLAAWHWVCLMGNEVSWDFSSTEVMEDWATDIARFFDLPYLSVKEDLQTAISERIEVIQ
jgi:hypothetical protein